MPKIRFKTLLILLVTGCFTITLKPVAKAETLSSENSIQVAQTTFKRRTATSDDSASANNEENSDEGQSDYDKRRAEREAQRAARAEARRKRAEAREQRSLNRTSGSDRSSRDNNEEGSEEEEEKEEDKNRGEAFTLDSLGKNDEKILSLGSVRDIMVGRLELLRNDRFMVGSVYEVDENNAAAELLTTDGALVQYITVDRKSGEMFFSLPDYEPAEVSYDPEEYGTTKQEADAMLQKLIDYEKQLESRFGNIEQFILREQELEEQNNRQVQTNGEPPMAPPMPEDNI